MMILNKKNIMLLGVSLLTLVVVNTSCIASELGGGDIKHVDSSSKVEKTKFDKSVEKGIKNFIKFLETNKKVTSNDVPELEKGSNVKSVGLSDDDKKDKKQAVVENSIKEGINNFFSSFKISKSKVPSDNSELDTKKTNKIKSDDESKPEDSPRSMRFVNDRDANSNVSKATEESKKKVIYSGVVPDDQIGIAPKREDGSNPLVGVVTKVMGGAVPIPYVGGVITSVLNSVLGNEKNGIGKEIKDLSSAIVGIAYPKSEIDPEVGSIFKKGSDGVLFEAKRFSELQSYKEKFLKANSEYLEKDDFVDVNDEFFEDESLNKRQSSKIKSVKKDDVKYITLDGKIIALSLPGKKLLIIKSISEKMLVEIGVDIAKEEKRLVKKVTDEKKLAKKAAEKVRLAKQAAAKKDKIKAANVPVISMTQGGKITVVPLKKTVAGNFVLNNSPSKIKIDFFKTTDSTVGIQKPKPNPKRPDFFASSKDELDDFIIK